MEKIIGLYKLIPAMLMILIVFYPFVANLFFTNTDILDNRPLHEKPIKFNSDYAKDFEAYYNDTFAGRKKVISKYVKLQKKLKIDTGQFFYGLNDWIFYDSIKANNGNILVDYYAEVYFDDDDLQKMAKGINMANDFYAKKGIKYMIVVAPNKENIYSEFMPERMQKIRKSDISRMDMAVKYLKQHTKVKIINLKPDILAAKSNITQNLYYKKDTHWNGIGCYIGFEQIVAAFRNVGFKVNAPRLLQSMIRADGLQNMDMESAAQEFAYKVNYREDLKSECLNDEDKPNVSWCKTGGTGNNKRLLMFADSFAGGLRSYINKTFETVYYIPAGSKKLFEIEAFVEKAQPDLVVDELVERYFSRYINYPRIFGGEYD